MSPLVFLANANPSDIPLDALRGWLDIDQGKRQGKAELVWQGNVRLLRHEQEVIVARGYQEIAEMQYIPALMSLIAENPFAVAGGDPFADGVVSAALFKDLTSFEQRWSWIETEMVDKWKPMPVTVRDRYVLAPFPELVDGFPNG